MTVDLNIAMNVPENEISWLFFFNLHGNALTNKSFINNIILIRKIILLIV